MQTKLLSFQPGSLYENGGAGRLLRRLYDKHEAEVTTLYLKEYPNKAREGLITEVAIPVFPLQRPWMRWHLRTFGRFIREKLFLKQKAERIKKVASSIECDVIHVINHGPHSTVLCDDQFSDKPLWVSFHDHFSTCSTFVDAQTLWNKASRRLMISKELGIAYQQLFGNKEFEIITDGVLAEEISIPTAEARSTISVYFAGLLHIDYLPLFEVLADALELLTNNGTPCELVLRGTQPVDFLEGRSFKLDYRSDFVTDESIKKELDEADILYLPIKFTLPDFYLYSLSTKMVGYLGASGAILYHGPHDSAACNLLRSNGASENYSAYDAVELKGLILKLLRNKLSISTNAKTLAKEQFDLSKIRNQFWNISITNKY
jgi:hypothetical protein